MALRIISASVLRAFVARFSRSNADLADCRGMLDDSGGERLAKSASDSDLESSASDRFAGAGGKTGVSFCARIE
ncbi:MAG: hypothetical protein AMXMBFR25_16090 [Lysobacterales bacterium]